jgi:hypothetical protein
LFYNPGNRTGFAVEDAESEVAMNRTLHLEVAPLLRGTVVRRGAIFGGMLVAALLAFEIFNYATTSFALSDVLGNLEFIGIRWSTVLALAFCGMDFAGIARLFTPQQKGDEPAEVWYLFGAWLLAAAFNAALTWWGVSVAIAGHASEGSLIVGRSAMVNAVPVIVAVMVLVIRVLIIGTFSVAGESLFAVGEGAATPSSGARRPSPASYPQPLRRPTPPASALTNAAVEPSYQPLGMSARSHGSRPALRQ